MTNYYYDTDKRKSYNRRQKARRWLLALALLAVLIIAGIVIYFWKASKSNGPVVIKPPTQSYYAGAPRRVFSSDRFSFESTSNWQKSAEESLGTSKYVYFTHSLNNNLIEFEFDVLFDRSLDGQPVNYALPVTVKNNQIKTAAMSERCGDKIVAHSTNPPNTLAMQFAGTNYICAVKGSTEKAAAGLVGGGYDIALRTPNGQPVIVNFAFVNNSSSAFAPTFKEVLESFKLK